MMSGYVHYSSAAVRTKPGYAKRQFRQGCTAPSNSPHYSTALPEHRCYSAASLASERTAQSSADTRHRRCYKRVQLPAPAHHHAPRKRKAKQTSAAVG
ncbi:uncharacterized protein H6S33_007094 [Morchella sextelata]|uniref:uncharacterized protein n=1 Tax=Morchella sextelata TaxID=1174677 RepID=UPI001D0492B8|nr:uncharacterized protein H6S33_007094 [Morchella sextelata]KAH0604063.1 hypothetical protein H6S33_007094 [Morchella sextelata]